MSHKDLKKSNQSNCWNCALRKKGGVNAFGLCMWWDEPKEIPSKIVDKGCKFWRDENAQRIIEMFDGELIVRR
jgi:hypothetical protein